MTGGGRREDSTGDRGQHHQHNSSADMPFQDWAVLYSRDCPALHRPTHCALTFLSKDRQSPIMRRRNILTGEDCDVIRTGQTNLASSVTVV